MSTYGFFEGSSSEEVLTPHQLARIERPKQKVEANGLEKPTNGIYCALNCYEAVTILFLVYNPSVKEAR